MNTQEKLSLLSSLSLWKQLSKEQLAPLAESLHSESHSADAVIFDEGAKGDSLYFVASGHVRIRKKVTMPDSTVAHKDLALLGPGQSIGEMTLFEQAPRSAQALASDDCVLLKLDREAVLRWLKSNPAMSMDFFTGLVQTLSERLRRSSNELISLFDVSRWLVEPVATDREFLQKCLSHLLPHLEGHWSAGAYLANEFDDDLELVATEGSYDAAGAPAFPKHNSATSVWANDTTYLIPLPGKSRLMGHLVFRAGQPLNSEEKEESAMLLTTSSRLIASALENLKHRTEERLRARLSSNREQYGSGF
jgi:CRP-like cAMP-binding protein